MSFSPYIGRMLDDLALYFSTRRSARPVDEPSPTVNGPVEPEPRPVERGD